MIVEDIDPGSDAIAPQGPLGQSLCMLRKLDAEAHSRTGSFDTIRLLAALMVFHSHSFALAGRVEPTLPGDSFGGVAVAIFFVISGYWVSRSALERGVISYVTARFLRIVPGLVVCLLVTIALCALASSIPVNQYFREAGTWHWMTNALPFFHQMTGEIPGVFEDGAIHGPNGSLWTLRYEGFCYVVAACAAAFGPRGLRFVAAGFVVFALAVLPRPDQTGGFQLTDFLEFHWVATFGMAFFFGAMLNGASDRRLLLIAGLAAFWMLLARHEPILGPPLAVFLYGALAIWAGRKLQLDRIVTRGRDLSYGVYIYAFPCEQLAVRALPPTGALSYVGYYAAALAATLALAWLSWVIVEKPALSAKSSVGRALERLVGRVAPGLARPSFPPSNPEEDRVAP
jgi:peptidoglycan/LPS O-acetylase OafA/YrhL